MSYEALRWFHLGLVCAHTIYNEKLYIFAGYGWKGCYLNDLYEFDFATRVWEQLTFAKNQQPPERHSMSFALYNDKWYMFGGIGPNGQRSNELFSYDFGTQPPEPLFAHLSFCPFDPK